MKGAEVQILRQNEVAVEMKKIYIKGKTEARLPPALEDRDDPTITIDLTALRDYLNTLTSSDLVPSKDLELHRYDGCETRL